MRTLKRFMGLVVRDIIRLLVYLIVIVIGFGALRAVSRWFFEPVGAWIRPHLPWIIGGRRVYDTDWDIYIENCMFGAASIMLVVAAVAWYIADRMNNAGYNG